MIKYKGEACSNYQSVSVKNIRWLETVQVSKKNRVSILPEEKSVDEDIKEIIGNSIKVSYRWIYNKMRREILNYYYYVDNSTCLCDKSRIFQSSNNWLSKFCSSTTLFRENVAKTKLRNVRKVE